MDFKIEKIQNKEELSPCAAILVDAYNGEPWNDEWTHKKALEKLECFYQSPKFHGWMAFKDDQLVGCCVGNIEPYFAGDYFYLKEMFILGEYQNKGAGRQLMLEIRPQLDAMEIGMIILFTANEGFPFKFWKKQGFGEMDGMRMMMAELA